MVQMSWVQGQLYGIGWLREGEYNLWLSKERCTHFLLLVRMNGQIYNNKVSGADSTHLGNER